MLFLTQLLQYIDNLARAIATQLHWPDEVLAVAAERRSLEESGHKLVVFHDEYVLLSHGSSSLEPVGCARRWHAVTAAGGSWVSLTHFQMCFGFSREGSKLSNKQPSTTSESTGDGSIKAQQQTGQRAVGIATTLFANISPSYTYSQLLELISACLASVPLSINLADGVRMSRFPKYP